MVYSVSNPMTGTASSRWQTSVMRYHLKGHQYLLWLDQVSVTRERPSHATQMPTTGIVQRPTKSMKDTTATKLTYTPALAIGFLYDWLNLARSALSAKS